MKRLVIVVEGDTEKAFIDSVLAKYLFTKGIFDVSCFKIKHTKGGLTKYQHLKTDLINCIFETNVIVSTLIDFYALPKDFPGYQEALSITNKSAKLSFIEKAILADLEKEKNKPLPNLIPYIQLHEFETLVFTSLDSITSLYGIDEMNFEELKKVFQNYPNPEEINESSETAPSKRLKKLIKGYNKINDGIMIIEETTIHTILDKCPRFNNWVNLLIEKLV